jgi:DNA-directed RNA polymerase specialized sigma24 family protein
MKKAPVKIDPLLEPLLAETSDERADELLLRLITVHAEPVIKGVIRYKLRLTTYGAIQRAEADDVYQEVILQLLAQVQRFRKLPEEHPITDLQGIAAVIAHRTCSGWMRRQFPERHALKNRLHYLLTRQRGLALWQDEKARLVAGFAVWQQQKKMVAHFVPSSNDEGLAVQIRKIKVGKQHELGDAVATIFNQVGGPIEFDELVGVLATLLGIIDQRIESLAENEEGVAFEPVAGEPDAAWQLEKRIFLQRLWEELQQLPLNQRAALLLNLKDSSGRGCITLFPATGVASARRLADALGMTADEFGQLWNDLPLEDARIAELLGLTRQQVINARKSGRERLARRLKGFF